MSWRKKFDNILSQYGHNVYLQRRLIEEGVGPYGSRENFGFSNSLEKHTVRSRIAGRSTSLSGVQEEMPEGLLQNVDKLFYFRWDANPDKHDRIYEPDPNGRQIYNIGWAHPFHGPGGAVIYWAVGATLTDRD